MSFRYDVAFSFAGEDRELVERIAGRLGQRSVEVFYDREETAELWGTNLIERLTKVYSEEARFAVLFISEAYASKAWPRQERRAALERALVQDEAYVLPVRLDDASVEGLLAATSYVDLREITEDDLVELIIEKVRGRATSGRAVGEKTKKPKRSSRPPPSRIDVLEAALSFAMDATGLEMDRDEALPWARAFADRRTLADLKTYQNAFEIGRYEIEWDLDLSMRFGQAVLNWAQGQFTEWRKVFEWLVSVAGPFVPPEDAVDYASQFISLNPNRPLREFKRAVNLAVNELDLEGAEAVEFALNELQRK